MKLNRSVALITGGAQGLGRVFAQNLLRRGTKVIVADLNAEAGEKFHAESLAEFGEDAARFLQCDVRNSENLSNMLNEAKKCYGRLDIICNNAGMMTNNPSRARTQVEVNLTAVIEGTYKGIELMSTQTGGDGGVIVNVGSAAGIDLMMQSPVFSATKHAVVAFSRSFKRLPNFKVDGVRVNCVCPYFCETSMLEQAVAENPESLKVIERMGMVTIDQVGEGFMKSIEDENLNGGVIVIAPNNKTYEMSFNNASLSYKPSLSYKEWGSN